MKTQIQIARKNDEVQTIRDFINRSSRFVVTSHIRPDGDAIGSVLAVGLSLRELNKDVQMVLIDGFARYFRFLQGSDLIQKEINPNYDVIISLDSSDTSRLGTTFENLTPDLNIDHHITNENFARINWVEPDASATCEILAQHMPSWGLPVTQKIAEALMAGILIDTIGFKTPNVTPKTLRLAADLVARGANLSEIYKNALDTRSFEALKYWGYGFTNLQIQGKLAWTSLSLEERKAANYPGNDDADLINMLTAIDNTSLSVIFVEQKNGNVKVSWRAKPGLDVSKIAVEFGGGGHQAAAGAEIQGSLKSTIEKVLKATKKLIE